MRMNKEVVMVRLADIIPNRFQPRLTFDEEALNELANSIKEHGIIQPLILRDLGSKYEIIAGERRYKASTIAGLTEVPAIVGSMDDQTSAELALIENIQRKDLSAIEEAKSYKKILDMGNFTQDVLAKRMGKSQSTIANKMRLLSLTNEVQVALMNNLISERHARCLLQIKDEDMQKEVLNKIITERMNVRDTDEYIKGLLNLPKVEPPVVNNTPEVTPLNEVKPEENVIPNLYGSDPVLPPVPELNQTTLTPTVEEPKPIEVEPETNNPNVYASTKNNDFVNIDTLEENKSPINNFVEELKQHEKDDEEQLPNIYENNNIEEIKEEKDMNNNFELPKVEETPTKGDAITRLKLATAIKLAEAAVEDISKSGYNATLEERDKGNTYEIVIKVEK